MSKFCEFCGKETKNGVCTCSEFLAAHGNSMQGNTAVNDNNQTPPYPTQQQYQQPQGYNQPYPPNMQNSVNNFANNSKEQFNKSKQMFLEFLKNPFRSIAEITKINDKISPIIFGIIHLVICFLFIYINADANTQTGKTIATKIGFKFAILILAVNLVITAVTYFISKRYDETSNFKDVLSVYCIATIPPSLMIIASMIVHFVSEPISVLLLAMAFVSWLIISFIATLECVKADKNLVFWIYLVIIAIVIAAAYYLINKNANSFLVSMLMLN